MVHGCNPCIWKANEGELLSLRQVWATKYVQASLKPAQLDLSQKSNKQGNESKSILCCWRREASCWFLATWAI